jgi:hypothetical protein
MAGYEGYPPPSGNPPPPGWQPAPGPPPPYAPPPGWPPAPGMLGAAHKPGAIPLRPLGLGDLYDGAFRVIRYNPMATVGVAALVSAVTLLVPVLVTALLTWTVGVTYDVETSSGEGIGSDLATLAQLLGVLGQVVGTIFVTGGVAHVVMAAAIGRRLSLGAVWAATHGKRWRLVGLLVVQMLGFALALTAYVLMWVAVVVASDGVALPIVFGLVSVPAFLALLSWAWTRLAYLSAPALMLEDLGVFGSLGRAFRLTRGAFWRTFGIGLLTTVAVGVVANIVTIPVVFVAVIGVLVAPAEYQLLLMVTAQALGGVLSAALTTPFTASVGSLQYVDLRMRQEAFDVELMHRAGITAS